MDFPWKVSFLAIAMVTHLATVSADGEDTIIVNALGRTFTLGMLYDRRSDKIIPGKTLWDPETLAANVDRKDYQSSNYAVHAKDSVEDKFIFMKLEAGVTVSFLGNLIKVKGSAGFLNDHRSSTNVARVSVRYHAETHFEQLTMAHLALDKIQHPEVLDDKEATHAVVGIEYGAEAFFIFEKTITAKFNTVETYGQLEAAVKIIPGLKVSAEAGVEMTHELQENVKNLRVKFHGDFVLSTNPTTFEEAVKIYQDLPNEILKPNFQAVPMRVYLYPLSKFDKSKIFTIVRDISESLINQLVEIMQELEDAVEEVQELEESVVAKHFHVFRQRANTFLNYLKQYKLQFQRIVAPLLVEIRGQGKEDSELAKLLEGHTATPFNNENLQSWLRDKRAESAVLESFVEQLEDKVSLIENVGEYLQHEEVISLTIYFPNSPDLVISNMDAFLDGKEVTESVTTAKSWFRQKPIVHQIQNKINDLLHFREINSESSIFFTYAIFLPNDHNKLEPYAEIETHYRENRIGYVKVITIPGIPLNLKETSSTKGVNFTWSPPARGADFIKYYELIVRERGHRLGQDPIEYKYQTSSNETTFEITTPDKTEPYDVYVYGVCLVGISASSEVLHHSGVEVRLVGGAEICSPRKAHSGRIEVLRNYIWGTVCGPWTDNEAAVACRMMGFTSGVAGYQRNTTKGSGQIWMSNVKCSGSESSLDKCTFTWATEGECNLDRDAVVDCYGGDTTGLPTTPAECEVSQLQELLTLARKELTEEHEEYQKQLTSLKKDVATEQGSREKQLDSVANSLASLRRDLTNVRYATNGVSTKLSKYFSVAFSARVSGNPVIGKGQILKFNSVSLNSGNGYNSRTGIFTVPTGKAGLYYFYAHLITIYGHYARFDLRKNGYTLSVLDGDNSQNSPNHDTITAAITVYLNQGDRVYIALAQSTTSRPLFYYSNRPYHGFTGFLMKPA